MGQAANFFVQHSSTPRSCATASCAAARSSRCAARCLCHRRSWLWSAEDGAKSTVSAAHPGRGRGAVVGRGRVAPALCGLPPLAGASGKVGARSVSQSALVPSLFGLTFSRLPPMFELTLSSGPLEASPPPPPNRGVLDQVPAHRRQPLQVHVLIVAKPYRELDYAVNRKCLLGASTLDATAHCKFFPSMIPLRSMLLHRLSQFRMTPTS